MSIFSIFKKIKFSLSTNIVIGLVLGISCGLFFGEMSTNIKFIGEAFVRLLQMTVLPYIVVSLVLGIGKMSYANAKLLALRGGLVLLLFWGVSLGMILILPLAFPKIESASFFSTSIVTPIQKIDYLDLYIPSNPFNSLANNVIPAIVLFCICIGITLIGMTDKEELLSNLETMSTALTRLTHGVVKLTPIGVFSIAACGAGTMTFEQFERLQVYFVTYIVAAVLMTFVIMPIMVMAFTKFKYRDILGFSKDALITGFITGNLFIVMPVVADRVKRLIEKYEQTDEEANSLVNIVVPVYFNFPDSGKLLTLLFVLFASWFIGSPMSIFEYPNFAITGLVTFFGGVNVALPFLLNYFQLPTDLFQLYLVTGVINGNFSTLLATMDLIAFTLVSVCAIKNYIYIRLPRFIIMTSTTFVLSCAVLLTTKFILAETVSQENIQGKKLLNMSLKNPKNIHFYKKYKFEKHWFNTNGKNALKRIRKTKTLRVGYEPKSLPFNYFNKKGKIVGYDVSMMNNLAKDLNCQLIFYPVQHEMVPELLNAGQIDICISGLPVTILSLKYIDFSEPYMEMNFSFIVNSNTKDAFRSLDSVKSNQKLVLAVEKFSPFESVLKKNFPEAKIIKLEHLEDYFSQKVKANALVLSAEKGSAWCLLHPQFCVVVPKPLYYKIDTAYAIRKGDYEFLYFLNQWLKIQKIKGKTKERYDYWVLGLEGKETKKTRWSIIRDVLHWVK